MPKNTRQSNKDSLGSENRFLKWKILNYFNKV